MRKLFSIGAVLLAVLAYATAAGAAPDLTGRSTLDLTLEGGDPENGFKFLKDGPGERYRVLEDLGQAKRGRTDRRRSLAYFGQLSDYQLADEESPGRVEFLDPEPTGFASSAYRPQEALLPFEIDRSIRQMNKFVRSPVRQGDGERARMASTVLTGDLADSAQLNETDWVARLLDGGTLRPGSGQRTQGESACPQGTPRDADDPDKYTGVQDYDDYFQSSAFYDPNQPIGQYGDWPIYRGLMDRAQKPFRAAGLRVPSYVAVGNHDGLVQGNLAANAGFEDVVTGCVKPLGALAPGKAGAPFAPSVSSQFDHNLADGLPPFAQYFEDAAQGKSSQAAAVAPFLVPPDRRRRYVDQLQYKQAFDTGEQRDGHGFGLVDKDQLKASNGAASYYDFSPDDGVRFIVLDTVTGGALRADSSDGNIDDPQFQWLRRELRQATRRDELIVVFSHHAPSSSQTANQTDEEAPRCTGPDEHGHDVNPGCDRDPRNSAPIHLGDDTIELLEQFPNVVAYVAGHSHENQITSFKGPNGGGFWEIKSPAIADWPAQDRLIEIMDNRDGTLSIFGTLLDYDSPIKAPKAASSKDVDRFGSSTLASIGRVLEYNDPQQGPDGSEGERPDRNVELLLKDPRKDSDDEPRSGFVFRRGEFRPR